MSLAVAKPVRIFFSRERNMILASISAAADPIDVTGECLRAIVEHIGPGHTLGLRQGGKTVIQITVAIPESEPVNGS